MQINTQLSSQSLFTTPMSSYASHSSNGQNWYKIANWLTSWYLDTAVFISVDTTEALRDKRKDNVDNFLSLIWMILFPVFMIKNRREKVLPG